MDTYERADLTRLPLALSSELDHVETPFEGDALDRQRVAAKLTNYVGRLECGAVLAIDAPWGEGKSWFARHWAAQLKEDGYRVGVIDAFRHDYVDDPFLMLASEIRQLCESDRNMAERITAKAAAVFRVVAPGALKFGVNAAGKWVLGTTDLTDRLEQGAEKILERSADLAERYARQKLEAYQAERESMEGFRRTLAEFAEVDLSRPVVLVVDELDRCRPAFAVALLERIKHFFDVPNLVFVLVMNRTQLESAIQGVYGPKTDASAYLGKFLHLSVRLPKERTSQVRPESEATRFAQATLTRYGVTGNVGYLTSNLASCVQLFDLSLREVQRVCALRFLSDLPWDGLLVCLAAVRIKAPDIYFGLTMGGTPAANAFLRLLDERRQTARWGSGSVADYLNVLIAFAKIAAGAGDSIAGELVKSQKSLLFGVNLDDGADPIGALFRAARSIDLDLSVQ